MPGCMGCVPPPASMQPRKTYNVLVPDVFPLQSPKLEEPIPKAVERKFAKLEEYIQRNPGRASKVSRRLTRRIKSGLKKPKKFGDVKIAVYAYIYLLKKSTAEDSHFGFNYFSKELVQQPDAVIQTLMAFPQLEIRCMGADLLAYYIKAQDEVDHQSGLMGDLVSEACILAEAPVPAGAPGIGAGAAAGTEALKVSCLRAVHEYMGLCYKLKALPPNLEQIEALVLRHLDFKDKLASPGAAPGGTATAASVAGTASVAGAGAAAPQPAAAGATASVEPSSASITTVGGRQPKASELAHRVLLQFRPFLADISTVYRVMDTLFAYLDAAKKWQDPDTVERLMALLQSSMSDQPFPLFTALMRHSSAPGLNPDDRTMIIKLALRQDTVYSLSAFSLALQELPRTLACVPAGDAAPLRAAAHAAMTKLAINVDDASQLGEAISSALRSHVQPSAAAQACLECALDAIRAARNFEDPAGRSFQGSVVPATLLQQLLAIVEGWGAVPDTRIAACVLLGAVVSCCADGVRDEKQAMGLLTLVRSMSQNAALGTPADISTMDRVLQACTTSKRPEVLLQCVRLSKVLLTQAMSTAGLGRTRPAGAGQQLGDAGEVRDDDGDRRWAVALLVLTNSLTSQVAKRGNCPSLQAVMIQVPREACASIKEDSEGLVSVSAVFEGDKQSELGCLRRVAEQWPVELWYGKVVDALCKGSSLLTHYSHTLQNVVFEDFSSHSIPGLPAPQASVAGRSTSAVATARSTSTEIAPSISSKLESLTRSRMSSMRRERINLQHVMDMLCDDTTDANGKAGSLQRTVVPEESATAAVDAVLAGGLGAQRQSAVAVDDVVLALDDVLKVAGEAKPMGAAAVVGQVQLGDLLTRLHAVSG